MVQSIINCARSEDADAVFVGAPYDRSASFGKGAAQGPAAILACLNKQIELFERRTRTTPADRYKIAYYALADLNALEPDAMVDRVATEIARHQAFTVLLGGEHSVSIGALRAHALRRRPQDVTVLQIDAHLDMRHDDSDYNEADPSPFAHSCVMRRAVDIGFRTCSVGVRAYSEDEYRFATGRSLPVFEWGAGDEASVDTVLASIATDLVYLTIDVDGFDPSVMPGTGTPVPGGLTWDYGRALIEATFREKTVIGADIVEVAPVSGSGLTEYTAAQLGYNVISYGLLKRSGALAFV